MLISPDGWGNLFIVERFGLSPAVRKFNNINTCIVQYYIIIISYSVYSTSGISILLNSINLASTSVQLKRKVEISNQHNHFSTSGWEIFECMPDPVGT